MTQRRLAIALLLGLSGCAAWAPKLQPPRLTLLAVQLEGGSLAHPQFGATLQVDNPNRRSLAVARIDYHIALGDVPVAQGSTRTPFTVPATGQAQFDLVLTVDLDTALRIAATHLDAGSLDYQLGGTAHLAAGLVRTLAFSTHGTVALK